jgi:PAS domain S-box-containing protein
MTFELFKELAETESLNSNYTAAQQLIDLLLSLAKTDLEKAELYNILIVQDTLLANYQQAIQSGCMALRLLDVIVPETNLKTELATLLAANQRILGDRPIASLFDAADMLDPKKIASLELLSNMVVPARYTDSTLFALISVLNVNISLRFGLTPKSTVGYTAYGMVLNSVMGRYQEALEFGELSLRLSERFNAPAQKCQACFMLGHYLNHWVRPLVLADDILDDGISAGLTAGEMQWTGYIFAYKLFQPFYRGVQPEQILAEIPKHLSFTRKTKNQWATDTLLALQLALSFLHHPEQQPDPQDEESFIADCDQHRSFGAKGRYAVLKTQILFLYGREQEALATALQAQELLGFFSSSISVAAYYFYHSLILTALYTKATAEDKKIYLTTVQNNQQQLKIWADNCAENFIHQYLLVEAELARIAGRELESERLYQQAIDASQKNGFIQDEGLANELTSRFYWQRNFKQIADAHLRAARSCYQRWGASAKVHQLDQLFPWLTENRTAEIDLSSDQFDAIAVIKASQAISDKILLPDLLDTLMRIVLENAGADKGCLILPETEGLKLAVTAQVVDGAIKVQQSGMPISGSTLPLSLITYVQRTHENIILDNAQLQGLFADDSYFLQTKPISVLCMPVLRQANLIGLLYLENSLAQGIFTSGRIKVLELLAAQAAISLENAILYRERGLAEEALRVSDEKYRAIFENCGTALAIIEEDTTLSICNREFQKLVGANKSAIEGRMKWSDFVADAEELRMMKEYHQMRRSDPGAAPQTYEFQLLNINQELKDIIVSVTNIPGTKQTLAALLDITDRKRADKQIIKMATIIDQAAEGITLTDKNWVIQYANPAFARITGYSQDEIIGQRTTLLKSSAHNEDFYQIIRDTMLGGDVWSGRIINKKKDGTLYEVDATGSPVLDESGEIVNFVGIQRDITKEIVLENKLRQSQKMEAIGTLAGGIAHDFNNILAAILGYSQLVSNKLPTESPLQSYLQHILGAGNRATELVKQILTYSRQSVQEHKPVRIDQLINEVLTLIRASIPTSVEIVTKVAILPEEAVVLADETQIHQVLMNLCTNAAHAIGANGGTLTLNLTSTDIDAGTASHFPDLPLAAYVKLLIEDSGHGIAPDNLERIFDPYFTTKMVGEGTGLGLSVVQGIVENHGGRINVDSEVGKGTCFTLLLPRVKVVNLLESEDKKTTLPGTEQILFVDDEESLTILGKEMLEYLGYLVTASTSSKDALEIFRAEPDRFALVITDRIMPGLSGDKLAERIHEIRPHIPIILCTGFSGDLSLLRAEVPGVSEIILKPYNVELMSARIRELIDHTHVGADWDI